MSRERIDQHPLLRAALGETNMPLHIHAHGVMFNVNALPMQHLVKPEDGAHSLWGLNAGIVLMMILSISPNDLYQSGSFRTPITAYGMLVLGKLLKIP